jgi:diacylglycerol kinase family enzyme
VAWAVLVTVAPLAWTAAAVATARRLELPLAVLRAQTAIALGVSIAMTAITAATATWWASVAGVGLDARLVVATALMLAATLAGLAGTVRAVIALDDGGAALR